VLEVALIGGRLLRVEFFDLLELSEGGWSIRRFYLGHKAQTYLIQRFIVTDEQPVWDIQLLCIRGRQHAR
jgi:hypothetical protein